MTAETESLSDAETRDLLSQHTGVMLAGFKIADCRAYLRDLLMDGRAQTNPMPEPNTLPTYSELYAYACVMENALSTFKQELEVRLGLPAMVAELEREWTDEHTS